MCGIVGYSGPQKIIPLLLDGLKKLEYRGYDSSGISYFHDNKIYIYKSEGKIENLKKMLNEAPQADEFTVGIGHTRWATHGKPTSVNAHPHKVGNITLVHNGIIENFQELKSEIIEKGGKPLSETDSELFGFLVYEKMQKGLSLEEAVAESFKKIRGSCSFVVLSEDNPKKMVAIRMGSPLVLATENNRGVILASDVHPIIEYSKEVIFLEDGDLVVIDGSKFNILDYKNLEPVKRKTTKIDWSAENMSKNGFAHFMLKEIYEQPKALLDTLNVLIDREQTDFIFKNKSSVQLFNSISRCVFVACGSSYYAALLAKYWIEKWAEIPCDIEYASEFRYRNPVVPDGALVIAISQSGETADTLAVIREMRKKDIKSLAITNVKGSSLAREADAVFYTAAGPEVGVASTKSFITQIFTTFLIAHYLDKKTSGDEKGSIFSEIVRLPFALDAVLHENSHFVKIIQEVAKKLQDIKGFFFIGRGTSYPIALEGALKLKEIAYLHAEGYAAGELKHGPIAMIDKNMAVVVLAPKDKWHEKMISNLQEVKSRGAVIVGVGIDEDQKLKEFSDFWIPIPTGENLKWQEDMYPFFLVPVVQLLSYEIALLKGTDVDQPRNLAKSVTVE